MFNVVFVSTGTVVASYDNGRDAGEHARAENERLRSAAIDDRVRVVRVVAEESDDWKERERTRFADMTYRCVPWHLEGWAIADHFAHVSTKDNSKLAYTVDAAHGNADRQTAMRPGRYLEQHYSSVLSQDDIRFWCAQFDYEQGRVSLLFAHDPDEIESVYVKGPRSCMSHPADYYNSPCHPVRVYGAGDLAIAYIRDPEGDVTARALVYPERKVYGRTYGDYDRLRALLTEAGYKPGHDSDDWEGARLLRLTQDGERFVAPYLDSPMSAATDTGTYLRIEDGGEIACQETDGLTMLRCWCQHCEESCDETYTVAGEEWCEHCRDNDSFYCNGCGEHYHCENRCGSSRYGDDYCDSCAEDMSECESCNYLFDSGDTVCTVEDCIYCLRCAQRNLEATSCERWAENRNNCECDICEAARESCDEDNNNEESN